MDFATLALSCVDTILKIILIRNQNYTPAQIQAEEQAWLNLLAFFQKLIPTNAAIAEVKK